MKPIVRTITGFISVNDFSHFDELFQKIKTVKSSLESSGYEIQTLRITMDIFENGGIESAIKNEEFIKQLENNPELSIYHLGAIDNPQFLTEDSEEKIVNFFLKYKKSFLTVDAGNPEYSRTLSIGAAKLCKKIASSIPFDCGRFALYAGVSETTPFYPASRVFNNSMKFSIGLQCANLAVEEAEITNKDRVVFENNLKSRMEKEFAEVEQLIPKEVKDSFIGFDTSLAPFPQDEISIANAIEKVLGKPFGSSGTLSICRILTRVMKENNIKKTGLCGLMLPVVEDNVLAKRGIEGRYTARELLLFSSVCATGLDTVPISGDTSVEDLADCYLDLVTLAIKLNKPLSARFYFEPDKKPGDTVKYDWKFACESPVFKI